jgi:hypothetical protein
MNGQCAFFGRLPDNVARWMSDDSMAWAAAYTAYSASKPHWNRFVPILNIRNIPEQFIPDRGCGQPRITAAYCCAAGVQFEVLANLPGPSQGSERLTDLQVD